MVLNNRPEWAVDDKLVNWYFHFPYFFCLVEKQQVLPKCNSWLNKGYPKKTASRNRWRHSFKWKIAILRSHIFGPDIFSIFKPQKKSNSETACLSCFFGGVQKTELLPVAYSLMFLFWGNNGRRGGNSHHLQNNKGWASRKERQC